MTVRTQAPGIHSHPLLTESVLTRRGVWAVLHLSEAGLSRVIVGAVNCDSSAVLTLMES